MAVVLMASLRAARPWRWGSSSSKQQHPVVRSDTRTNKEK